MFSVFALAATVFWTTAYVLIIRQSLRDKVYGMPILALCLNISWEFLYTVVYPGDLMATISFAIWLILDVGIAWIIVRYGPSQFPRLSRRTFYAGFVLLLAVATAAILVISAEFDDPMGRYAAFGQNLLMSALFLAMLHHRGNLAGQSLGIAVAKTLGTVNASILSAFFSPAYSGSPLLLFCYLACFVLDLTYVAAILRLRRRAASCRSANGRPPTGRSVLGTRAPAADAAGQDDAPHGRMPARSVPDEDYAAVVVEREPHLGERLGPHGGPQRERVARVEQKEPPSRAMPEMV